MYATTARACCDDGKCGRSQWNQRPPFGLSLAIVRSGWLVAVHSPLQQGFNDLARSRIARPVLVVPMSLGLIASSTRQRQIARIIRAIETGNQRCGRSFGKPGTRHNMFESCLIQRLAILADQQRPTAMQTPCSPNTGG